MSNLQRLPPSLREKHRYIIFELLSEEQHGLGAFVDAAWDTMLGLLGEAGTAEANPWILKDLFDEDAQRGGIRVSNDSVESMRAALALITAINGVETTVHVLGVTGTIDSAERKYSLA